MRDHRHPTGSAPVSIALAVLVASACADAPLSPTLRIAGIPDQSVSALETTFSTLAQYLSDELGIAVEYVPSVDYAAVVTAFKQGDVQLAWFGGLTGVQARLAVPNAVAIAQRPRDQEFHSVFVASPSLGLTSLEDVRGHTLTFGSESSTSGHLMPRHFLIEAGVDPDADLAGPPSYSGSHDTTWKLVESGAFEVGALNEAVWDQRVAAGEVDLSKVDVFLRTPAYYDYHWVVRGDLDVVFGEGTADRVSEAILKVESANGGAQATIGAGFQTDRFIPTVNDNYKAIEDVAVRLGIVER